MSHILLLCHLLFFSQRAFWFSWLSTIWKSKNKEIKVTHQLNGYVKDGFEVGGQLGHQHQIAPGAAEFDDCQCPNRNGSENGQPRHILFVFLHRFGADVDVFLDEDAFFGSDSRMLSGWVVHAVHENKEPGHAADAEHVENGWPAASKAVFTQYSG